MSSLRREEPTSLVAIVTTSLKLAGERDPKLLLQGLSHLAREIMTAQYASVGIFDEDGQTIGGPAFSRGRTGMVAVPAIPVLRPGLLANMLVGHKAFRLRNVTSESLGFELLPEDYRLASVLAVPLSGSSRLQGFLFFANKLDVDEFNDEDERMAVTLGRQITLAYERMEEQSRAQFRGIEASRLNWSNQSPTDRDWIASTHLHDDDLCLYVQGRLSHRRSSTVEAHVLDCKSCENRLSEAAMFVWQLAALKQRERGTAGRERKCEDRIPANALGSVELLESYSELLESNVLNTSRSGLKLCVPEPLAPEPFVQIRLKNAIVMVEVRTTGFRLALEYWSNGSRCAKHSNYNDDAR
jgi:hypothetical protein